MKAIQPSHRSLLLALGLLALAGCSQGADNHGHDHGPDADHAHDSGDVHEHGAEDDHGHEHGDDGDHHDHAAHGEPVLGFALTDTPVAGQPFTFSLILSDAEGLPVGAGDLATVHDHKLHVLIVDEALEDYTHTHPALGPDGLYQVTFTPEYGRTYRVWADYTLAETGEHDHGDDDHHGHGEDDHSHAEDDHHDHGDDHDNHHAMGGNAITVSEALIVGETAGPELPQTETLTASAGGLTYTLQPDGPVTVGAPVRMTVSVTGADGAPFQALEPIMGAYAHLVGFNAGATEMVHAHPEGDHPHGANSRGGPDLQFEVTFKEPGPHRLFLQTVANGEEQSVSFTMMAAE